jgi:peptide/nickel transport system permease protein
VERDYVAAADALAIPRLRVVTREIIPSVSGPLMVESGLRLTYSISVIAGLGLLGFGQPPPTPSWGGMIYENLNGIGTNPLAVLAPAAVIAIITIGTNTLTDAVAKAGLGGGRSSVARTLALEALDSAG